jgi:hypothetical protein
MKKAVALLTFLLLFVSVPAFAQYADSVGKVVELKTFEQTAPIYAGTDKKMFNVLTGDLMGVNKEGYSVTMLRHKGFEVENNTKARILEINYWEQTAKVEILDGARKGWVGWVLLEQAIGY